MSESPSFRQRADAIETFRFNASLAKRRVTACTYEQFKPNRATDTRRNKKGDRQARVAARPPLPVQTPDALPSQSPVTYLEEATSVNDEETPVEEALPEETAPHPSFIQKDEWSLTASGQASSSERPKTVEFLVRSLQNNIDSLYTNTSTLFALYEREHDAEKRRALQRELRRTTYSTIGIRNAISVMKMRREESETNSSADNDDPSTTQPFIPVSQPPWFLLQIKVASSGGGGFGAM